MSIRERLQPALRAALLHLCASALVAALAAALVFGLWYPAPYGALAGGFALFTLVVAVDVVCGPLLTLVVFDRRKPRAELARDIGMIAVLQLAALAYGLYSVAQARPIYLAYEGNRFRVVSLADVDPHKLSGAPPEFRSPGYGGPRLVGARLTEATDPNFQQSIVESLQGLHPSFRPERWVPYESQRASLQAELKPLAALKDAPFYARTTAAVMPAFAAPGWHVIAEVKFASPSEGDIRQPAEPVAVLAEVPFSSARKWSGATLAGHGTVVMGAPDVLARAGVGLDPALSAEIAVHAGAGRRVVLVAQGATPLGEDERLPADLVAVGAAVLAEGLRDDAVATIAFMVSQGVDLKVISGDGVGTVSAVAAAAGVPNAERALSGADLPTDPDELERVALETTVFARVSPEQKRELLAALARRGRYTAMVGDGVNDVLALKEARLAIVMGNGSQMAKGVGDLVLLSNAFSTVPRAVEEGRRIIRNTHRVAKLFVAKSVYAAALLGTFGLVDTAYPFLPRHTTLVSSLTIGIPAFFLALASSNGPVQRERFLRSLAAFVVPAGLIVWLAIAVSSAPVVWPSTQMPEV